MIYVVLCKHLNCAIDKTVDTGLTASSNSNIINLKNNDINDAIY